MKELAGRLASLDPDALQALQVIGYFDRLLEGRAGLEALVRGAAVLTGVPARLSDERRRVQLRVDATGRRADGDDAPDPDWPWAPLEPDGPAALWLERPGPAGVVEAMVLERAAAAIRTVLDRTRGKAPAAESDQAMIEVLLDASAAADARLHAARRLGLSPNGHARAIAVAPARPETRPAGQAHGPTPAAAHSAGQATAHDTGQATAHGAGQAVAHGAGSQARILQEPPAGVVQEPGAGSRSQARQGVTAHIHGTERAGIGPAVPILDLPASWVAAQTALRLTAEGTERDPGPRAVYAEELGGLAVLAAAIGPDTPPVPDVRALDRAASTGPWMLATLDAVATTPSLRAAATAINVHHSTLQDRLTHAEHLLGWSVHTPHGRLRLQLALALRRLHRAAIAEASGP